MKTWRSVAWGIVAVCALFAGGCKKKTQEPLPLPAGECVAGASEGCTCEGGLSGLRSCSAAETWGACVCSCVAECSGRVCGPDPACGMACGSCGANELCNDEGQCEPNCTAGCIGRECGTDPVCGTSCGTCGDSMVCEETAGQCNATVLTLRGRTIPDANVEVLIGADIFSAVSDADGNYVVAIGGAQDQGAFVRIRSIQRTNGELAAARMSFAGVLGDLSAVAGANLIVEEEEHHGVVVDAQSTIRWAALYAANGGRMFADAAELANAEENANEPLSGQEWLVAVAWLQGGLPIPTPGQFTHSLEIVENIYALRELIAPYVFNESYFPTPFDAARAAILEGEADLVPFPSTFAASYFQELLKTRDGTVGAGGRRWDFNADGSGSYYDGAVNFDTLKEFTWSVDQDGAIVVVYDVPVDSGIPWYLTTEQIADRIRDENIKQQVELFLGAGNQIEVYNETLGQRFTRVESGAKMDWMVIQENVHWRLNEALSRYGLVTVDETVLEWNEAATWRRADTIGYIPFTEDEIVGDWALHLNTQSDEPPFLDPSPVKRELIFTAMMRFDRNGTVTSSAGRSGLAMTGTWELDASGRLSIEFNGTRHEYAKWADSGGAEKGVMYRNQATGQTSYRRAAKIDPMFVLTPGTVSHDPSQYWQTTINAASSHKDSLGIYPDGTVFGFTFDTADTASRVSIDVGIDPPSRELYLEQEWSWAVEQNQLALERRRDKDRNVRCNVTEPSCVGLRMRRWVPIAQDGAMLVVLEWEVWLVRYIELLNGQFVWTEVSQHWVDPNTGEVLDPNDVAYLSYPRVNAYYLEDLPAL